MSFNPTHDTSGKIQMEHFLSPVTVLVFLVLLVLFSLLLGTGFISLLEAYFDLDWQSTMNNLSPESSAFQRNFVRFGIAISHTITFLLPAVAAAIFFRRKAWASFLSLHKAIGLPTLINSVVGVILLLAAFPLAQFLFQINKKIPLPEWAQQAEATTNTLIQSLMVTEAPYELLLNIVVIALLPAIGEEMIFRGIIQKSLQKWSNNPHVAVWLAAAFFSLFHMQFEGFLPRMMLGALLGYLLYWSGTLIVPIIAHFFNNALQIVSMHLYAEKISTIDPEKIEALPIGLIVISLIFVLGISFFLIRFNQKNTSEQSEENELGISQTS